MSGFAGGGARPVQRRPGPHLRAAHDRVGGHGGPDGPRQLVLRAPHLHAEVEPDDQRRPQGARQPDVREEGEPGGHAGRTGL